MFTANSILGQTKQALVFNSEQIDLAALLFTKAGKVEYIS